MKSPKVKSILNEIGDLKKEREEHLARVEEIDKKVAELQGRELQKWK